MSKSIEERFPENNTQSCAWLDMVDEVNAGSGDISDIPPRTCTLTGICAISRVYIVGLGESPPTDKFHVIAADVPRADAYRHPAYTWCPRSTMGATFFPEADK